MESDSAGQTQHEEEEVLQKQRPAAQRALADILGRGFLDARPGEVDVEEEEEHAEADDGGIEVVIVVGAAEAVEEEVSVHLCT